MARTKKMTAAELIAAAQAQGGLAGREALPTEHECPSCKAEGKRTTSGGAVMLRSVGGELTCIGTHGIIKIQP